MVRHTILLKSHWITGGKRKKGPDLVDRELASSSKAVLYPTDKFLAKVDTERTGRIRLYRGMSSFTVYAMIFCMLYFSSNMVDDVVADVRAKNENNKANEDAAIVKRKMTTNLTQDEYMSSLPYDRFLEKIEEQIKSRKRRRKISAQNRTSVEEPMDSIEVERNANSTETRNSEDTGKEKSKKTKVASKNALSFGNIFKTAKVSVPPLGTGVASSQESSLKETSIASQTSLPQMQQLPNTVLVGAPNKDMHFPQLQLRPNFLPQPLPEVVPMNSQFTSHNIPSPQQQLGNNQISTLGLAGNTPLLGSTGGLFPQSPQPLPQFMPLTLPQAVPMLMLPQPAGY